MKHIRFVITACTLLCAFTLFSCASKPKADSKIQGEIEDYLNSEAADAKQESGASTGLSSETADNETDLSDADNTETNISIADAPIEEPLTEEQNPELPELPEDNITENKSILTEEPAISPEPEVKDAVDNAAQNQNVILAQNSESSAAVTESASSVVSTTEDAESRTEANNTQDQKDSELSENSENTEKASTSENDTLEPGFITEIPNPSRSITIQKNQLIDILYPGKGWIYQGNIDEEGAIDTRNKNFIFGGRKLGGKDTAFTLRSRLAGTYLLHFFKNDVLTGNYIDDYLEVIVQDKNSNSQEHVTAPSYAEAVPPKATITAEKVKQEKKAQKALAEEQAVAEKTSSAQKGPVTPAKEKKPSANQQKDSEIGTVIQTTESTPGSNSPVVKKEVSEKASPAQKTAKKPQNTENALNLDDMNENQLLDSAKKLYEEKDYPKAFSAITKFFDKATSRLDEGLFLQGQILEEKSSVQNIKDAIESYDLVVNNYPSSSLWDKANKRSIFLKRFYINIR